VGHEFMCWFRIRFCQFHLWSESMMASCFCNANEWWGHTGYDLEQASGRTLITWWNSLLICWSWIVCKGLYQCWVGITFLWEPSVLILSRKYANQPGSLNAFWDHLIPRWVSRWVSLIVIPIGGFMHGTSNLNPGLVLTPKVIPT
jgi:hypothetical protein